MSTDTIIMPVSPADVGTVVLVSQDGKSWEPRLLARIVTQEISLGDDEEDEEESELRCYYVCWNDDVDGDGVERLGVTTWKYAKPNPVRMSDMTPEATYVIAKKELEEKTAECKKIRQYLVELAKVISENWHIHGYTKKEVLHGGRRFSLSLRNAISCSVLAANRTTLKDMVKNDLGLGDELVVEGVSTPKLKKWLVENAVVNPDGTYDLSFVPEEMAKLFSTYQRYELSVRSQGVRE